MKQWTVQQLVLISRDCNTMDHSLPLQCRSEWSNFKSLYDSMSRSLQINGKYYEQKTIIRNRHPSARQHTLELQVRRDSLRKI